MTGGSARRSPATEYAVVGYTPPKGSRRGIGSLLLATPDARTRLALRRTRWQRLRRCTAGRAGRAPLARGGRTPTVHVPENGTDLRQAKLAAQAGVRGGSLRPGAPAAVGLLRQASFKALRPDRSGGDAARQRPTRRTEESDDEDQDGAARAQAGAARSAAARTPPALSSPGQGAVPGRRHHASATSPPTTPR
jgi:bifunctional non-homologous end joining protein LigD